MIFTDRTIIVQKGTSSINDTIVLYRGDKDVEIRFTLNEGSPFKFGSGASPNIIEKTEAAYGQLIIKRPNDLPAIFSEIALTNGGKIVFTITTEMIDEITEVGNYTFQIRLFDENRESRATIPEVVNGIEIREPIATEDVSTTNEVGVATVGYALTTAGTTEDAFDSQGNYNKTTWGTGDRITAAKLNKIEAGIDGVNKKVASGGTSGGEVDLSNYVTKETGNANQITFADGQTFQAKLDTGTLKGDTGAIGPKGEKGDKGDPGIQGPKGDPGVNNINDATASATTTYSSNKIENIKENLSSQIKDIVNNGVGGGLNEQQVDDRINLKLSTQYKANPVEPLNIKTYDGSNQPTHPSVKYFENAWNGHKYWMAYTPYPNNNDSLENPCITYSDDGVNWSEEGISNPIVEKPTNGYNSDCHLVLVDNTLECWWREVSNNTETIKRKKSTDGVTWGDTEILHETGINSLLNCLSPTVIYDENKYKIWVVYQRQCLKYYESVDGTNWVYIRDINLNTLDGAYKVWHIDVIKNGDLYEFVGCYQYQGQFDTNNFIYYAKSSDNITYSTPLKILSNGDTGQFDDLELYRPCLCIDDLNNYRLYYGAQKDARIWHIGLVTCRDIMSLNNLLVGQNSVIERLQSDINTLYELLENSQGGVTIVPVTSISLNKQNSDIQIGKTLQLNATVLPDNATNKTVTWKSSDDTKATVSATGLVTAIAEGEVSITCTSSSNKSISSTCIINVVARGAELSGLVFNLSAENYSSGTSWTETVGNNNATISGEVIKENNEVLFTGSESFSCDISSLGLTDFTLEWYGTLNGGDGEGALYFGSNTTWGNSIILWRTNPTAIKFDSGSNTEIVVNCSQAKHKIILTYDSNTNVFNIYVDSSSLAGTKTSNKYGVTKSILTNKSKASGQIGGVEYIKIYNRVLDSEELNGLFS